MPNLDPAVWQSSKKGMDGVSMISDAAYRPGEEVKLSILRGELRPCRPSWTDPGACFESDHCHAGLAEAAAGGSGGHHPAAGCGRRLHRLKSCLKSSAAVAMGSAAFLRLTVVCRAGVAEAAAGCSWCHHAFVGGSLAVNSYHRQNPDQGSAKQV